MNSGVFNCRPRDFSARAERDSVELPGHVALKFFYYPINSTPFLKRNSCEASEYNAKVLVTFQLLPPDCKSGVWGDGFTIHREHYRKPEDPPTVLL